jgi:hypothetical protein
MTIQVLIQHMNPGYDRNIEVRLTRPDGRPLNGPGDRILEGGEAAEFLVYGEQSIAIHEVVPGGSQVGMDFGGAIRALKAGKKVARVGWNGKGMWLAYTPGSEFPAEHAKANHAAAHRAKEAPDENVRLLPHIDMRAADGSMVIGWLASQTDMLSDDWMVVE